MLTYSWEQQEKIRSVGQSALRIACLCFMLMVLGSVVRATDSGLSCPDWPMCFGKLIPQMDIQIFLEWFHRLIALFMGLMLLRMGLRVLRSSFLRQTYSKEIFLAFGLFLTQCVLGGLTVLKLLKPSIVSSHLLTALLFFSLLLWIWRRSSELLSETPNISFSPSTLWSMIFVTILVYLQLGVGGMVSSNNAGLICPDFPQCHGQWLPPGHFLPWVQMTHRYLAFVLFAFAVMFFWKVRREKLPISTGLAVRVFPLLLAVQILLGVLNIIFAMPLWVRAAHHANGIFLFAVLFVGSVDLYRLNVKRRYSLPLMRASEEAV